MRQSKPGRLPFRGMGILMTFQRWITKLRSRMPGIRQDPPGIPSGEPVSNLLLEMRGLMLHAQDRSELAGDICHLLTDSYGFSFAQVEWFEVAQEPPTLTSCSHTRQGAALASRFDPNGGDLYRLLVEARTTGKAAVQTDVEFRQQPLAVMVIPLKQAREMRGWLVVARLGMVLDPAMTDALVVLGVDLSTAINRLYEEELLRHQVAEVEQAHQLSSMIIQGIELPEMFTTLVAQATELLDGDAGGLYLADAERRVVRCVVSHQTRRDYTGTILKFGEGAAGYVAEHGQALKVDDYRQWDGRAEVFDEEQPFHALISAPLKWQGKISGVIHVLRDERTLPFSQRDLEQLVFFADQAAVAVENIRLLTDIRQRVWQLDRLNELTRDALRAGTMSELVRMVAGDLTELFHGEDCVITFWDESQRIPVAAKDGELERKFELLEVEDDERTLTRAVLEVGHPIVLQDPAKSDLVSPRVGEIFEGRMVLAMPMIFDEVWFGAALVTFAEERELSGLELQLAEQAAGQVALALAKMQALDRERLRTRELEAVREASLSVASNLELTTVLTSILTSTLSLVAADDAHIFLYDGDQLTFGASQSADGAANHVYTQIREDGLTYTVARTGERIVIADVDSHPLYENWNWGGAIVGLPLKIRDRIVGVMNVAMQQPHQFDEAELRALELLADQAALMIQNASLYENVVKERRSVQLVYGLAQELANSLDQAEILDRAIALTTAHLGARSGEAFLLDQERGVLELSASYRDDNLPRTLLEEKLRMQLGEGLVGWVAEHRMPVLVDDVTTDRRWATIRGVDDDVRSAVCAPLTSGGELLGVISFLHRDVGVFNVEHLDLLIAIARQVSLALSNAQQYGQVERRLVELTVVRQVMELVNRRLEMDALLEEVVQQVGTVLGYPVVEVYLVEEDDLILGAAFGGPRDKHIRIPINQGIIGRVVRTNHPAFVPDVSQDPDYLVGLHETRSEIAVPLHKEGVVIGVLNIESPVLSVFSDDDVRLLSLLANQLSIAVENSALYERLRQHASSLEETVNARTAELAEALEQARAAEKLKSQFVSDVSHELRTPLSNIRLYLDLMRRGRTERYESYLQTLNRETNRLVVLIEDLLAVSRIDAGSVIPYPVLLDLNALARGLVEDRQRLFADRGLDLEVALDSRLPRVSADERMISQVLANLMTNALNYTPAGGKVQLKTRIEHDNRDAAWAVLSVTDNGLGIAKDEQEHIFERFFRGKASRMMGTPGTGLGLSICKEVIERHGGRITLQSAAQRGSTFSVWLPVSQQAEAKPD
jgi:GAF domain-containing protein/two-component sensor histidine kinase